MQIDLEGMPFVDGHMHAPLAQRPATADDYVWPWYEGNRAYLEMANELVPFRWGMRQLGEWLGCDPEPGAIVAAIATRSDEAWRAECIEKGTVGGLVLDTGYPPPDEVVPHQEIAKQVPVAWLVRIEVEGQRLLAEADSLEDWLARVDAASEAGLDAGAAGLKSIIAYRTGLGVAPVDMAAAHAAFGHAAAAAKAGEEVRLAAKPLNDLLVLRALDVCRRRDVSLQLHAGYGDRDIDLRLGTPFAFRWALESGAADGVAIVFLHASWPHIRDAAVMAAIHHHVYVDIASCIPPIGHAGLVESWREALTIAPITRIQASSDAAGVFEHVTIGALRARQTLGIALGELVETGELSVAEAERRRADPGRELAQAVRAAVIRTYGPGCRDCRYDVVDIPTLDAWPFALYPEHLLLCLDARAVPTEAIGRLAEDLILGGLHAVLCHGPDCERVHDIFDETEVQLEIDGRLDRDPDATILSSWHDYETFADTLFAFAMFRPADSYPLPTVRTVVLVDRPDRARDVHRWLPAFCRRRPG